MHPAQVDWPCIILTSRHKLEHVLTSPQASYTLSLKFSTCSFLLTSVGMTSKFDWPIILETCFAVSARPSSSTSTIAIFSPSLRWSSQPRMSLCTVCARAIDCAYFASSTAAAWPIPLAAPVITATRPSWNTGWTPSSGVMGASKAREERVRDCARLLGMLRDMVAIRYE